MRRGRKKDEYSTFISLLLKHYEGSDDAIIQVNKLSSETGVEKRRLYDLLNVLTACGVCEKSSAHAYCWRGLSVLPSFLSQVSRDIEARALYMDIDQLFFIPDSPAIGALTVNFIAIFVYYGIPMIPLREISMIMTANEERARMVMRRLYSVVYVLERIGVLKHALTVGECLFNADLGELQRSTFVAMAKENMFPPDRIEFELNRFDDMYISQLQRERKSQFMYQIQQRIKKAMEDYGEADIGSGKIFPFNFVSANSRGGFSFDM